jgi:CPA2 family monovalent cation:H+ antiporter-2
MVTGYIIAGMLIGPFTPPFSLILNFPVLTLFAELGVILLLLVVGMEFPIERLREIGKRAFVIAMSEALGTLTVGYLVCQSLNYSLSDSFLLALAISVKHGDCYAYT